MKKLLYALLITVCLFSLASCSKNEKNDTTTLPPLTDAAQPTGELTTEELTVTLTFPEGWTVKEMAELLEQNGVCTAKEFISLINNTSYLKTLSYSFLADIKDSEKRPFVLEGYIFPDTYEFYKEDGAETALTRFLDNTEQKLTAEYKARAAETGYTMDEIITIASIIQEEASEHQHMPGVSSVLHNRLEDEDYGMLQCDVTIHYIDECVRNSPYISADPDVVAEYYDTYECYGLPTGPICNPGIHAIEAALNPPKTEYFYFVTDDEWNYYYAETYEEHQVNCENVGIYGR